MAYSETLASLVKVARPIHWVKNASLFAALVFTGGLYTPTLFMKVFWAFVAFNFATSATYVINDIFDIKLDRLHPTKKDRVIASGKLPVLTAVLEAIVLIILSLTLASVLNPLFFLAVGGYVVMQAFYSAGLKNLPILDILLIAAGFIIRVYAGAVVIDAHLSVWFLLCVISVALFLASGKRRAELNIIAKTSEITRKSLLRYKRELLNSYVTMFGNAAWMSWALFSFFESPKANPNLWLFLAELSKTTTVNKLLMITIPITIFGIMRYEALIFEERSEAPEKLLLTDKALIASVVLWVGIIVWIYYGGVTITF